MILGGGAGALATAFALTDVPGWQECYDITIYQQGWRLGGKGQTGRNERHGQRIEEHGIHLWSGFYQNAFRLIRRSYAELQERGLRSSDEPLSDWRQAFQPQSTTSFGQLSAGRWIPWSMDLGAARRRDCLPGTGGPLPTPFQMILQLVTIFRNYLRTEQDWAGGTNQTAGLLQYFRRLLQVLEDLPASSSGHPSQAYQLVARLLAKARRALRRQIPQTIVLDHKASRLALVLDLGMTWMTGMIEDGVIYDGFDVIDDIDYRQWLVKHGALAQTIEEPGLVRSAYEYLFSYRNGDYDCPDMAAGVALRMQLRLILTSDGATWWRMVAGFGDTVFAPLFLVLRDRGVRFQFFHRATRLDLSPCGRKIDAIHLHRQAELVNDSYEPLIQVQGLPCWPAKPLFEQLIQGPELEGTGVDLESSWNDWPGAGAKILTRGSQSGSDTFDRVVLAVSLEPLKSLSGKWPDLPNLRPWRRMLNRLGTAQTMALQLWLRTDLSGLGVRDSSPVLTAFAPPFASYVDMSDVLRWEAWNEVLPDIDLPRSAAYFCGMLKDATVIPPPLAPAPEFQSKENSRAYDLALNWMRNHLPILWPGYCLESASKFDQLACLEGQGEDRFAAQFWQANIDPSQRYVLALTDTTQYRLLADETGLTNAFLAGDMTLTGLNCGCVEAAVMSGFQAARAICGYPKYIWGEQDFQSWQHFPEADMQCARHKSLQHSHNLTER